MTPMVVVPSIEVPLDDLARQIAPLLRDGTIHVFPDPIVDGFGSAPHVHALHVRQKSRVSRSELGIVADGRLQQQDVDAVRGPRTSLLHGICALAIGVAAVAPSCRRSSGLLRRPFPTRHLDRSVPVRRKSTDYAGETLSTPSAVGTIRLRVVAELTAAGRWAIPGAGEFGGSR